MKKMVTFIRKNSLSIVSIVAMLVGLVAVGTASWITSYQPECPKELLK
ncbi:MAG: cyclic lactone autoinducer peptide [Firmicutes bacterium]|nr:cyclic lactone autoinducer peptide [Bacillota bacterium]